MLAGTKFGGYASQVVVPAGDVVPFPEELTFEQGAAIPVNYATAWAGLIGYGNLQPGERVLIHSAGGGVGIAATQIAKRYGAEVYGTASPGKHARIWSSAWTTRSTTPRAAGSRGCRSSIIIMDAIGGQELSAQLRPAAPRRATGRVWRLRGRLGRAAQPGLRAAAPCCGCRASA